MIKPLGDRVVLKVEKPNNKTKNGIYLLDTSEQNKGTVVAVGPGRYLENGELIPLDVKVGDQVVFNKFTGTKIKYEDEEYLILHEGEIIAVIDKELVRNAHPRTDEKKTKSCRRSVERIRERKRL